MADLLRLRLELSHDFQIGEQLSAIVENSLGEKFSFHDEVVRAILDSEPIGSREIGEKFWSDDAYYVRADMRIPSFAGVWKNTQTHLRYSRRFFSDDAKRLFKDLFSDVEDMRVPGGTIFFENHRRHKRSIQVVVNRPEGLILYRSRICEADEDVPNWTKNPFYNIGPPPPNKARAGRMNAEGVVVLYCAGDEKTSLAEMRPGLASRQAVIRLRTTRKLRLLDFRLLATARASTEISDFHPDYLREHSKRAFLRRVHSLISRPVAPGNEADYLITQTMAEYLAHVHEKRFDGIIFESAQRKDGVNYVIFRSALEPDLLDSPESFPVEYVEDSLEYFQTKAVTYEHDRTPIQRTSKGAAYIGNLEQEYEEEEDGEDDWPASHAS